MSASSRDSGVHDSRSTTADDFTRHTSTDVVDDDGWFIVFMYFQNTKQHFQSMTLQQLPSIVTWAVAGATVVYAPQRNRTCRQNSPDTRPREWHQDADAT